ncbi:hypothetical protein CL614_07115 [archaeon]|nr:hypothetical protein [archaeon]
MRKPATIFDHIANITYKKVPWDKLSDLDQKSFQPYIINRWLSMNMGLIEIINLFQQYTIGPLSKKHVYQLYYDILPAKKMFSKYIKGHKVDKYKPELVEFIRRTHMISKREANQYLDMFFTSGNKGKEFLKDLLKLYGKSDKEIKGILK